MKDNEYGVVFSGGGTKGAYEVGAWKALKELKLNITCVVGTSIGAINAALAIQNDMKSMEDVYHNIKITDILSVKENFDSEKDIFDKSNFVKLMKDLYNQKGFDNAPLRKMLEEKLNIDKIYKSKIDLGIMTYSIDKNKPVMLFKNEIEKEKLNDYLLASSCFPIYKSHDINGEKYYDGGFYDTAPVNMLIKKGYKNIIIIDISGVGFRQKRISKNIYIKTVKNSVDLGGTFDFNKKQIKNNIELGYLDTMKAFNKITGHVYFFNKKEFNNISKEFNLDDIYGMEIAAKIYGMNRYKMYTQKEFIDELLSKHYEVKNKYVNAKSKIKSKKGILEIKKIISLVSKGFGVCFFMDYILGSANYDIKLMDMLFGDYIEAARSMIELEFKYGKREIGNGRSIK